MAYVGVLRFAARWFEKSLPGPNQPNHQDQSRCQLFFFFLCPILDLIEDTWQAYLAPHACGSNQHHQGEFVNSEDRTFSCWVRPENFCASSFAKSASSLLGGCVSEPTTRAKVKPTNLVSLRSLIILLWIYLCISPPALFTKFLWLNVFGLNVLNSSFNSIHQTFNMQWAHWEAGYIGCLHCFPDWWPNER